MNKRYSIVFLLALNLTISAVNATIPDNMPESVYQQIVQTVITEIGHLDSVAVEEGITQWQLSQPLPSTDAQLIDSGTCVNCIADDTDSDSRFKQPRKVKVKAKLRPNGKFPSVLKIKWKKPKKLPASIRNDYDLSHYNVYISKDDNSYETLRVDPKYKRNGKLKKKQKIKFKDRSAGNYQVQVQAVYSPTTTNKSSNKNSESEKSSPFTGGYGFSTSKDPTTVGQLTGAIKTCLLANGHIDATLLLDIITPLDCSNQNLQNSDIDQIVSLSNIRSIDLSNNPLLTQIQDLADLNYLEYLVLSNNPNIVIPDFTKFTELKNLYLADMGLTVVPDLSSNDSLETLDLSDNLIAGNNINLPDSLMILNLKNTGSSGCDDIVGQTIGSVSLSGDSILSIESCSEVLELAWLSVTDAPNLVNSGSAAGIGNNSNKGINIDSFNGFCQLSFRNTGIEILSGSRPIDRLHLFNNSNFTQLNTIKPSLSDAKNDYPDLLPTSILVSGTELMSCEGLYNNKAHLDNLQPINMADDKIVTRVANVPKTAWQCPNTLLWDAKTLPDICMPDPVQSLNVYEDINTQRRFITWEKDLSHDYSQWGVTGYEIKALDETGGIIFQRMLSLDFEQPFVSNILTPTKYSISACTAEGCGYETALTEAGFEQGLSRVTDLNVNWVDLQNNSDAFNFVFNYPSSLPIGITWEGFLSGLAVTSNSITKTGSNTTAYYGAMSLEKISGDGYVEFQNTGTGPIAIGLTNCDQSSCNTTQNFGDIDYAINMSNGLYRIVENGNNKAFLDDDGNSVGALPFVFSDIFRVSVINGFVKYFKNNELIYTSVTVPQLALNIDAALQNSDSFINNISLVSTDPTGNTFASYPTEFRVYNNFEEAPVDIIPVSSGNTTTGWSSTVPINYLTSTSNSYSVHACNEILGCGIPNGIIIQNPVTSSDLDGPESFVVSLKPETATSIMLNWNVVDNPDIDYFEVHEKQPRIMANLLFSSELDHKHKRQFYLEANDVLVDSNGNINQYQIELNRQARGGYEFELRSCHRDRLNGDVCSLDTSGEETIDITRSDVNQNITTVEFNFAWYQNNDDYGLVWDLDDAPSNFKPDYFYLRNRNYVNDSTCQYEDLTISYAEKIKLNNINLWTVKSDCLDVGGSSRWVIQGCYNGVGCTNASSEVQVGDPNHKSTNTTLATITEQTNGSVIGGPGDLLPGAWWNSELSGTGWHFYWASELRYDSDFNDPATNSKYGKTYDLIGYWMAYSEINGVWTPTWYEARMKQVLSTTDNPLEGYFEGDIFYHDRSNGGYNKIDVGNIQLYFGSNNQNATLHIDPDHEGLFSQINFAGDLGPYTVGDGKFVLAIEDFGVGIMGSNPAARFGSRNDADHYSGLWQHFDGDGNAEVSILTWIERSMEISTFAMFDTKGVPIWLQGITCNGSSCNRSTGGHFSNYKQDPTTPPSGQTLGGVLIGFNPLSGKPLNHDFNGAEDGFVNYYGKAGRCYSGGNANDNNRFKEGSFWLAIPDSMIYPGTLDENGQIYTRSMASYGSQGTICDGSNAKSLIKKASLHDIRFFINDQHESVTICDPNDVNGPGECVIKFTWYTDDDFPNIKPYYSIDNGSYSLLSNLCGHALPDDQYVIIGYECTIATPGTYTFQLHKDKYDGTGTVVIAESVELEIIECIYPDACEIQEILEVPDTTVAPIGGVIPHQPGAGPIPGSGGVSGGSATYNLPLAVPPGRNGMTPSLSVNYSSKGGNGILGVGWSLSVGSSIYRCPQTQAQDDNNHAVNFSDADRLCLDGQRLMLVNATGDSSYWVSGAQYRTEQDSFAKIVNNGDTITVQTKSGRTNTYTQQGLQQTTWQLTEEKDSFGNYITYNHLKYGENEWLLDKIVYTEFTDSPGNRLVEFKYENRQKGYSTQYLSNEKTEKTQRLDEIITTTPDGTHRTYGFIYNDSSIEDMLLLENVTEKAGSITRTLLEATWQGDRSYALIKPVDGDLSVGPIMLNSEMIEIINSGTGNNQTSQFSSETINGSEGISAISLMRVGADINGDGSKELLTITKDNNGDNQFSLLSYDTNGVLKGQIIMDSSSNEFNPFAITNGSGNADFNGDGITDMLLFPTLDGDSYTIAAWKGNAFPEIIPPNISVPVDMADYFRAIPTNIPKIVGSDVNVNMTAADFNNDGYPDLIYTRLGEDNNCGVGACENIVYYRKHLGINSACARGGQPPCTHNPEFGPEKELKIIDSSIFSSSLSDKVSIKDLNGDGYPDILITNGREGLKSVQFFDGIDNNSEFTFITKDVNELNITEDDETTLENTYNLFTDLNADGLDDFLYVSNPDGTTPAKWNYRLNTGDLTGSLFSDEVAMGLGGYADGLPETENDCNLIEYGANPDNNSETENKCAPRRAQGLLLTDVNSDGINDILLPDPDNVLIDICLKAQVIYIGGRLVIYDHAQHDDIDNSFESVVCSDVPTTSTQGSELNFNFYDHSVFTRFDRSVYGHNALIIKPIKQGATVAITIDSVNNFPTIYKQIGSKSSSGDFFGDGDEDYTNRVVCPYINTNDPNNPFEGGGSVVCETSIVKFNDTDAPGAQDVLEQYIATNYGDLTYDQAKIEIADNIVIGIGEIGNGEFFVSRNDSITSGLLSSVEKPAHNLVTEWAYKPLSTDNTDENDPRHDFPLYTVPDRLTGDSYVDEDALAGDHFYFNSSMYVVSEMRQTNNYGNNAITEYAYEEAVYNNKGRGFQGFRKISVRSNPDEGSMYETTSESTFHQVFPYAGKLEKIEVFQENEDGNVKLTQQEDYTYVNRTSNASNNASFGVNYFPLTYKKSQRFELNNSIILLVSESITDLTAVDAYDDYGNIKNQTSSIETFVSGITRKETTTTSSSYYDEDTADWWVDKLKTTQVTKEVTDNRAQSSATATNHATFSRFIWKNLSTSQRQLDCQYTALFDPPTTCTGITAGNNNISENSFGYDTKGNIINVTTKATDEGVVKSRSVSTIYDTGSYFPVSINKSGLLTSFTYDNATGQVLTTTAPDDNSITTTYDAYGFKVTDEFFDSMGTKFAPDSFSAIRNCNGNCSIEQIKVDAAIDTNTQNNLGMIVGHPQLKYYTEQRQNGQPQVITWYDSANNPVISKTYHSDHNTSLGITKYNYAVNITSPLGINAVSTQPFITLPFYKTISAADAQGRIVEKVTTIEHLNSQGGSCTLNTLYTHNGTHTEIDAGNSGSSCTIPTTLTMFRIYDVTGKLLSTTDADTPPNTVKYWYDASGNPLILQDAAGNHIITDFDALGRKQSVNDPNMGLKTFQYNGFGEVIQQTDAESHKTYYQYDTLGRIVKQYSNVLSGMQPMTDGTRSYDDTYVYDLVGRLSYVTRQSNMDNNECDAGISICFKQHYNKIITYDNQSRVSLEETFLTNALTEHMQTPGFDDVDFNTKYYYDGHYNRLKQVVYDDSYSVENRYTKHGALEKQLDATNGFDGPELMKITSWNEKGQETNRMFNGLLSVYSQTAYYPSTGQIKTITNATNGDDEILDYQYDAWGNIATQGLTRGTTFATENFVYDDLHRLTGSNGINVSTKNYAYNNIGNITVKNDFSNNYTYGQGNAGPNAVTQADLIDGTNINYSYDASGNRIQDCKTGMTCANYIYDYNNLLVESTSYISDPLGQTLEFNYGADNQRYRKYDKYNNEITLYANKDYEQIFDSATGQLKQHKYYLTSYLTITKDHITGTKRNFMQKDRLGSTTQILDEEGVVLHTKSYDAFGKPRNGDWSDMGGLFDAKLDFADVDASGNVIGDIDISKRGFTDHEHLDEMQLIHMNGRMYDYNNGRFLSVDPFVTAPSSTQALNPYTYIFNNPLSGVDPSGYTPIALVRYLPAIGAALGRGAAATVRFFASKQAKRAAAAIVAGEIAKEMIRTSEPAKPSSTVTIPGDTPTDTPLNPPDPTNITDLINNGNQNGSVVSEENGNQNNNQGTMLNENGGNISDTESEGNKGSRPTDQPVDLEEDLAGQELIGEFENGGGKDISDQMGDTDRFGEDGSHDKVTGSRDHPDGTKTEVHADRNRETGELSNEKFKDAPDNNKSRKEDELK